MTPRGGCPHAGRSYTRRTVFSLKSNQLLPFERNRYYIGKLLTSADFQAEQTYGNHKRRFLNELVLGSGIICGLGVYSLDDLSIMIESGVAVDGWGREVVLENAVMKKLSAIDGFDTLETSRAVLCLRYNEESVDPVYAISGSERGESYEYNRLREGWELRLFDRQALAADDTAEPPFLTSGTLYEDSDYCVTLTVPAVVSCGERVRLRASVEQLSETTEPLTFAAELDVPALENDDGGHTCTLHFDGILPGAGKTAQSDLWFRASAEALPDSTIMAGVGDISVRVGEKNHSAHDAFMLKLSVLQQSPEQIIAAAVGSVNLEDLAVTGRREYIELAEFALQRTKNAYIIEGVRENGIKKYIRTNAAAHQRAEYEKWFSAPVRAEGDRQASTAAAAPAVQLPREPLIATGVCEIPIPPNAKKDQVVYSDEIVHGLGNGLVYVSAGLEYFTDDPKLGSTARSTVYGDAALFSASSVLPVPSVETAVRVMNDRGSFIVAVKLNEPTPLAVLTLRWNAYLPPAGSESSRLGLRDGRSISAVRPTVVMYTRESHYFSVAFKNMEPCTLNYELTEKNSGAITPDGIYTAPGREGIYEIRIYCADMPLISTYAYAVVKKRMGASDETEEQLNSASGQNPAAQPTPPTQETPLIPALM